jgi:hypothetical protein
MTSNSKDKSINKGVVSCSTEQIQMLKDNLKRNYAERIRRHQIALDTMEKLRKAKFL